MTHYWGVTDMKNSLLILLILTIFSVLSSQELVISGWQESNIEYTLEQTLYIPEGISRITVSIVQPQDFSSLTYQQKVLSNTIEFKPDPTATERESDELGNVVHRFRWESPPEMIWFSSVLNTKNSVKLSELTDQSTFPAENRSTEFPWALESSDLIQANDPSIIEKAREITADCRSEFEAVRAVLHFVVDHLQYTLIPKQYDALYALQSGQGNCQNYSHLSAALLREVDIPVRIVNGVTMKKSYTVPVDQSEFSFEMAEGRHSWVEVYLADFGWLPFDAQQTEFFVSNRYVRIEFGRDNNETIQDGLVRWTGIRGDGKAIPRLEEAISSDFLEDRFEFRAENRLRNIRKLLLTPPIRSDATLLASEEPAGPEDVKEELPEKEISRPPDDLGPIDYTKLKYSEPIQLGNLEFPKNYDFLASKFQEAQLTDGSGEIRRNFMVETAEYVTGKQQFAQMFVLDKPVFLRDISLALHCFGGEGPVWIDIADDDEGQPSEDTYASRKIAMSYQDASKGYDWVVFSFDHQDLLLTPGRYWMILNFEGSPIINWFYSYGKPVGPVEGTRSRKWGSREWGNILSFEFNYRVNGLTSTGIEE
jgi:hypothetical protein